MRGLAHLGSAIFSLCFLIADAHPAQAYKLKPTGTDDERTIVSLETGFPGTFWSGVSRRILDHFSYGVHEEVTHRSWGCDLPQGAPPTDTSCTVWATTPAAVLYGIQWNDNPPFKLDSTNDRTCQVNAPIRLPDRQPNCWRILFGDAAKRAAAGEYFLQRDRFSLLYRSHFGDLQFLHAMASWDGETMSATKAKIMMWAEFTYRVSVGEIAPATTMSEIRIPGFRNVLGQYWSDVTQLFAFGVPRYQAGIGEVALGSLLHMVQDSFSKSHVSREAPVGVCGEGGPKPNGGRILEFHAYGHQDGDLHGEKDSRNVMLATLLDHPANNVVTVGRYLKAMYDRRERWDAVKAYLDACVFAVAEDDLDKPAGPGAYRK
jgi:hypothetical protein